MTTDKAIANLRLTAHDRGMVIDVSQTDWLDTVELAIAALERDIPRPTVGTFRNRCPVCGGWICGTVTRCDACGQKVRG
jgi:hypothetical protein